MSVTASTGFTLSSWLCRSMMVSGTIAPFPTGNRDAEGTVTRSRLAAEAAEFRLVPGRLWRIHDPSSLEERRAHRVVTSEMEIVVRTCGWPHQARPCDGMRGDAGDTAVSLSDKIGELGWRTAPRGAASTQRGATGHRRVRSVSTVSRWDRVGRGSDFVGCVQADAADRGARDLRDTRQGL